MKKSNRMTLANIEADGGAWKLEAERNIIAFLECALAETGAKVIG